jgi:fibronectin type 3 domain-containing protein/alpha-tubulin suppressor-like RCC1 family protein
MVIVISFTTRPHAMYSSERENRMRPGWIRVGTVIALLSCGCFHFDRTLAPGEITGTAVFRTAAGTLAPAAGAKVVLENSSVSVTANSKGVFVLTGLPAGTFTLDVTDTPQGLDSEVGIRLSGLTLPVQDGLDVGQIVLDAFGAIQGTVTIDGSSTTPGSVATIAGLEEIPASNGSFSFPTLLPGTYSVTVFSPGNPGALVSAPVNVRVAPAATAQATIALSSQTDMVTSGAVQGAVQLAGTTSNGNVDVQFSGSGPDLTSGPSGMYEEGGVTAGLYTVTASLGGFGSVSVPYVVVGGGTTTIPTMTLFAVTTGTAADAGSTLSCVADSECPLGEVCLSGICGAPVDGGVDAGTIGGGLDAGVDGGADAGATDGGIDAGVDGGADAGPMDGGIDAGVDGGADAGVDAGELPDAANLVPSAPTGVSATAGDGQIVVQWSAQAGLSYNLYYSTTSGTGVEGSLEENVSSPFTVTGLTDGTTYYIVVTAVNGSGESVASDEVSATPQSAGPPASPTGVNVISGSGEVTVTWNGVSGATGYNVYYSTTPGGEMTGQEYGDVTSPCQITGLTPGQIYYFVVTAFDNSSEGMPSDEMSATVVSPAPTFVAATAGTGSVTVSWEDAPGATSYTVYWSTTAGMELSGSKAITVVSPFVVSGLTNGTPYYFVVTTVNPGGESPPSTEVNATPMLVSGVLAIAGNGEVSLTWNGIDTASSYNIYRGTQSGVTAGGQPFANVSTPAYVDKAVKNYTDYFYIVTAVISGVESTPSVQVSGTPVKWVALATPSYDGNYGLGITDDGRLWSWGSNQDGVLGLGSSVTGSVYFPTVVDSGTKWTAIAAGGQASFGIAGGALYSWGYDGEFGGLGCLGMGTAESQIFYTPTQVGGSTNWKSVASADNYNFCTSLAVQSDGSVWNWGDNFGTCPGNFRYSPSYVTGGGSAVSIGVRGPSGFLVSTSGTLLSWGVDLSDGLLGLGDLSFGACVSGPSQVGSSTTWTAVAGGNSANFGITGGALYSWGSGDQLGSGNSATAYVPAQLGTATNWTGVFASYSTVFGIADGALYAWGDDNGNGALGLGSGQDSVLTPTQVGSATNWAQVAASIQATLALDTNGNLWSWGNDNGSGMLGLGSNVGKKFTPTQVSVP